MATTNTLYKSINLESGEQFTLPPGAELISATNIAELESTCNLGTLEDLNCYAFVFGNAEDDGNDDQLFEATEHANTPVVGIKFNDTIYTFSSPFNAIPDYGVYDLANLITAINGTSAGNLLFEASSSNWLRGDKGTVSYIVFKSTPSIIKNLYLIMQTPGSGGSSIITFYIPVSTYSDVSGLTNIPSCS